ncbi:MAG: uracil-DNA glycosylase [bacterium]|nr:uracil-DNA glycosylase [bacterium]
MNHNELNGLIRKWLQNEKLLGKDVIELEGGWQFLRFSKNITGEETATSILKGASIKKCNEDIATKKASELEDYYYAIKNCNKCNLYRTRNNLVFGEGNPCSKLVFIGEAPGREEDMSGRPFVGEAGKLLTKLIKEMGLDRSEVYITNIIKCRPPDNRDPLPEEIENCRIYLEHQLEIIKPSILCTLGRYSTYYLLGLSGPFSSIRGKVYKYKDALVIPTYHPAALLYHPGWSGDVKRDLKLVMEVYDGKFAESCGQGKTGTTSI